MPLIIPRELAITVAFRLNAISNHLFYVVEHEDGKASVMQHSQNTPDTVVWIGHDGMTAWDNFLTGEYKDDRS